MTPPPHPLPKHTCRGFSLIETVLALGIMGLAITALLGLLPQGIEMSRKAANAAAETRILDTIVTDLSSMSAASLAGQLAPNRPVELHFDDQGVLLNAGSEGNDSAYFVRVEGETGLTLPGGGGAETLIRRGIVKIAPTPLPKFNFDNAPPKSYTAIPVLIGPKAP